MSSACVAASGILLGYFCGCGLDIFATGSGMILYSGPAFKTASSGRGKFKMIGNGKSLLAAAFGLGSALLAQAPPAWAANSVSAGVLNVERPTLNNAGFDWRITGDDNHNATATVQYRKKGDKEWKAGLPLLRSGGGGEFVGVGPGAGGTARYPLFKYEVPNMLTGSIFNLTPDTDYESQFTLSDPDGGKATKSVAFHTRK